MGLAIQIPLPSGPEELELPDWEQFLQDITNLQPVQGGVASVGEAAAYALVWEFGNARQTKTGPKTVLGTNPDGSTVWLSIQAPTGYIRIHEPEYLVVLEDELGAVDLNGKARDMQRALVAAIDQSSARIARIIANAAPVDTGQLQESIQAVRANDPSLNEADEGTDLAEFWHPSLTREARVETRLGLRFKGKR